MTKFLSSTEYLYPPRGGGEHALRNLLLELEERGHETVALHNGEEDPEIEDYTAGAADIPGGWTRNFIQSVQWGRKLSRVIEKEEPDYVVTQLGLAPVTQKICEKRGVPCIILLIDYSHLCIERFAGGEVEQHSCLRESGLKFKWQYPFYYSIKKNFEEALRNAEHVFSNSEYMKEKTEQFLGVETEVLYPPIDYTEAEAEGTGEHITMINPSKYKGGEIFAEVAREMPEENFLALGSGEKDVQQKLEGLENVETVEHVDKIKQIYSRTKLLLVPSQWPEPFGMVAPEAMHNKIPALVSGTGGLPEAAGLEELQVENFQDPKAWKQKIQSKEWKLKQEYREHSEKFSAEKITEQFLRKIGEKS
ncbi:MAG: glycosyltransferase family 4 protein [Candidatus Nanohalobium sp.]